VPFLVTGAAALVSIVPAWAKFKTPAKGSEEKVSSEK